MNRACFPKENTRIHKNGEIHELFVLALSLVWFAPGPTPDSTPKGPFRTKNTTTIAKIVNYYAIVFLLRPLYLLRCGPFVESKNVCNSQERAVRTKCAAIVNDSAIVKILRVVNLLRVVFLVRRGPLGMGHLSLS